MLAKVCSAAVNGMDAYLGYDFKRHQELHKLVKAVLSATGDR